MGSDADEIDVNEFAGILGLSVPTATAIIDCCEIVSRILPDGSRRVRRADALALRAQRDAQREALRELAARAQLEEGQGLSLPSTVSDDAEDQGCR